MAVSLKPTKKVIFPYLLVSPVILVLLAINLYPTIYQFYISLTNYRLASPFIQFVGLENYARLLQDGRFWHSIWITLQFLLGAIPIQMIFGTVLALLLFNYAWRRYVMPLFLLSLVTTPVVIGYMFQYMFREGYGLITWVLKTVGVTAGQNLTADPATVIPAIIMADVWQWTPFVTLIVLAGLQSLPVSVFEAADIDGASMWQRLRYITIPMLKASLMTALLFRVIDGLRIFDKVFTMTRGGPGSSSETISVYLRLSALQFRQLGYAAAMSILLLVLAIILTKFCMRLFDHDEGQYTGSEDR